MISRVLGGVCGAALFAILVPIIYWMCFSLPFGNFNGILMLAGIGMAIGAILGTRYPEAFSFLIDFILGIFHI